MDLTCFADCHTHSKYSFDGREEIDIMCAAAISRGLSVLTITDHCDIDDIIEGRYPEYKADEYCEDLEKAKEKYAGKLILLKGVELGQSIYYPQQSKQLLEKYDYDFVIGSMHNLLHAPDFSQFSWSKMTDKEINYFFGKSLEEIEKITEFPGISTIAHINYPLRYIRFAGLDIKYDFFLSQIERIYKKIINKGLSLECNTSGWHKNPIPDDPDKRTLPDTELLRLYYSLGGRKITIGSDAHTSDSVGVGIAESLKKLKSIGFEEINIYIKGKPVPVPINTDGIKQ